MRRMAYASPIPLYQHLSGRDHSFLRPILWAYNDLQGEVERLPSLGTADHRFGPLHVMHARFEGDHGDLLRPANRVGELFLHAVVGLLLRRVGDCRELGVAAASGEDVLLLVHIDSALSAVKPALIAR